MPEHPSEGLERLDPKDRALIELSSQLTDDEIAEVLQVDADDIRRMRDGALRRLEEVRAELELPVPSPPSPEPERERPRGRLALLVALLVVAAGAGIALAVAGGGDDDEPEQAATTPQTETAPATQTETTPAPAPEPEPEPAPKPKPKPKPKSAPARAMDVLNDTHGRGTARLVTDGRTSVRLSVRDFLEPQGGGYAVWLFNSENDARRLFATRGTDWTRTIALPADYDRYRYIEIARAVPDLNSDHSGLSLLRVAIADLQRKG